MKKIVCGVLIIALMVCSFYIGKMSGSIPRDTRASGISEDQDAPERNLRISVTTNMNAGFSTIPLEQGNYKEVSCYNVENVTIDIGGISMKLEDALRDGLITVDEMVASARRDASLGLCREAARSKNGLTEFIFFYDEFRLHHVYDIYETPDGKKHLITDFAIYGIGSDDPHFRPVDEQTGSRIDHEDWGLVFEVTGVDASGITIKCSQSGGQQIGTLNAGHHFLYRRDPNTNSSEQIWPLNENEMPRLFTSSENWEPDPDRFLTMGGTTELTYDLARLYGQLTPGEYVFVLQLVDCYDKEEVSPLTRNFYDAQSYEIEFRIE